MTLGLVRDDSGFIRRSRMFAGNVVEGTTLAEMLDGLEAPASALVIMDRGIATEENIAWFITVLAYQAVQAVRRQLKAHGITESWPSLRALLCVQHRVTATFSQRDGRTLHVRKATVLEPALRIIYNALGLPLTPGGEENDQMMSRKLNVVPLEFVSTRNALMWLLIFLCVLHIG